jgi:thioredoxin reductase
MTSSQCTRSVDLVVTGDHRTAFATALDAVQRGRRVLVVLPSGGPRAAQRFSNRLRRAAKTDGQLTVMANAEVVCADGVGGVEAVVIRHSRTGRLSAVNASSFLPSQGSTYAGTAEFENRQGPSRSTIYVYPQKKDNPI